jgi:hypothetical protein
MEHAPNSSFHNHKASEEEKEELNPFEMKGNTPPRSPMTQNHHGPSSNPQKKIPHYEFEKVVEIYTWLSKVKSAFKVQHMYDQAIPNARDGLQKSLKGFY